MGDVQGRAGAKLIGEMMEKKRVTMITLNNDFRKVAGSRFPRKGRRVRVGDHQ